MNTINFESFFKYFQNLITEKAAELYEDGLLENQHKFIFFNNSGDYLNAMQNIVYEDDQPEDPTILVNILNGGGVQDSSVSIDAYVQIVSFEVLALDSQRNDMMMLFSDITANYKSYIDQLDLSTIQITFDDFPKYSEKFDCMGYEKFTVSSSTNIVVLPGALLSNKISLTIDGENIKFNNLIMTRTTELKSDLQKRTAQKFYPNTTGFQIQITGLFVDSDILNTILADCANAAKFNQYYNITIKKINGGDSEDTVIYSGSLYSKDITFTIAYGSIVSWTAVFYEGTTV